MDLSEMQTSTQGGMGTDAWPQSWDWEEFLFAGKLHRCGYAAGGTMVLMVAVAGDESKGEHSR